MVRSAPSCFKIITCATNSIEKDDLEASSQTKVSSDKRGWSFRKRSPKHRVVNNAVISESLPSGDKDAQESTAVNYDIEANNSVIPNESSETQCNEMKPPLTTKGNSKLADIMAATEDPVPDKHDVDHKEYDESDVIVIQAAIKGFLVRRSMLKHKNVVKLQAAVRGHIVRSHAVGTLRCVQAIVKMQTLVRARQARLSSQTSSPSILKQNTELKPDLTSPSIQKLLSNSFARQLMDSTPKTKPVKIKCDPSRSDSAWKWLERWVAVSPTGIQHSLKPESNGHVKEDQEKDQSTENGNQHSLKPESNGHVEEDQEKDQSTENGNQHSLKPESNGHVEEDQEKDQSTKNVAENAIASTDNCELKDLPTTSEEPAVSSEIEESYSATCKSEIFEVQANVDNADMSSPNEALPSELISQMEQNPVSGIPNLEIEESCNAPEQPETEVKKVLFGSRKATSPAFIAAQSKFEELTSSAKSVNSSNQDFGAESCTADTISNPTEDLIKRTNKIDPTEDSLPNNSRTETNASECGSGGGTIPHSSTLDSSVPVTAEHEQQPDTLEEAINDSNSNKLIEIEAPVESTTSITVQLEKLDDNNCADEEVFDSEFVEDRVQIDLTVEENPSVVAEVGPGTTFDQIQHKPSSPEASPRSPMTVPDSHGTPSSQVSSSKAKKIKIDKNGSKLKRKSLSAGKRSPIKVANDSGARSSFEKLPKERKRTEELKEGGSTSNSLPSYMQATESAKAKAQAGIGSPRSSSDVQEKDIVLKKRHSLPGANGRHGSPHIQRSKSHARQKENTTQPSEEKKWQR